MAKPRLIGMNNAYIPNNRAGNHRGNRRGFPGISQPWAGSPKNKNGGRHHERKTRKAAQT